MVLSYTLFSLTLIRNIKEFSFFSKYFYSFHWWDAKNEWRGFDKTLKIYDLSILLQDVNGQRILLDVVVLNNSEKASIIISCQA